MPWLVGRLVRGGGTGNRGTEPWGPLLQGLGGHLRPWALTLKDMGSTQQTVQGFEQRMDKI